MKLADNPVQNIDKLSNEFLNAYYGKAAPQMEAYLTYLEDRLADVYKRLDMAFISRMNSGDMAQYVVVAEFPDREFFEKADAWFDKAEKVLAEAHDEKSLRHVREERAVVDRTVFDFWPRLEKQGYKANLKDKARRYGDAKKAQAEAFLHTARGKYVDEETFSSCLSAYQYSYYLSDESYETRPAVQAKLLNSIDTSLPLDDVLST